MPVLLAPRVSLAEWERVLASGRLENAFKQRTADGLRLEWWFATGDDRFPVLVDASAHENAERAEQAFERAAGVACEAYDNPEVAPAATSCFESGNVQTFEDFKSRWNLKELWTRNEGGRGAVVFVVDWGISPSMAKDPLLGQLSERLSVQFDFDKGRGEFVAVQRNYRWDSDWQEPHGTLVATVASTVAPLATIVDVKAMDSVGSWSGSVSKLVAGFFHVRTLAKQIRGDAETRDATLVVNCSAQIRSLPGFLGFGARTIGPGHPLYVVCGGLMNDGITVVMPAGNCDQGACADGGCKGPAKGEVISSINAHPDVVTVGGRMLNNQVPGYSLLGTESSKPNVYGFCHYSIGYGERTLTANGTSFAAPSIAGTLAALRTAPGATKTVVAALNREMMSACAGGRRINWRAVP